MGLFEGKVVKIEQGVEVCPVRGHYRKGPSVVRCVQMGWRQGIVREEGVRTRRVGEYLEQWVCSAQPRLVGKSGCFSGDIEDKMLGCAEWSWSQRKLYDMLPGRVFVLACEDAVLCRNKGVVGAIVKGIGDKGRREKNGHGAPLVCRRG